MIGNRFGMLVVTARAGSQNRKKTWHCVCDCGGKSIATTGNLNSGNSKSCGCEQRDAMVRARTTHGQSSREKRTRAYSAWANMLNRCKNKADAKYPRWGGRGIRVCKRWHKYENFLADMGEPPEGLSLDRKDNDGDYKPSNCRWANAEVQRNNQRRAKLGEGSRSRSRQSEISQ